MFINKCMDSLPLTNVDLNVSDNYFDAEFHSSSSLRFSFILTDKKSIPLNPVSTFYFNNLAVSKLKNEFISLIEPSKSPIVLYLSKKKRKRDTKREIHA